MKKNYLKKCGLFFLFMFLGIVVFSAVENSKNIAELLYLTGGLFICWFAFKKLKRAGIIKI